MGVWINASRQHQQAVGIDDPGMTCFGGKVGVRIEQATDPAAGDQHGARRGPVGIDDRPRAHDKIDRLVSHSSSVLAAGRPQLLSRSEPSS